jgi:hypothetical protein
MATPDHTPAGRGYDTALSYFHHSNDYWTFEYGTCAKSDEQRQLIDETFDPAAKPKPGGIGVKDLLVYDNTSMYVKTQLFS